MKHPDSIQCAKAWVLLGVLCHLAGWGLSAAGLLDARGYLCAAALAALCILLGFRFRTEPLRLKRVAFGKLRWRYRHFLPALFLAILAVAFLGGLLYAPSNYDSLTYRFPRVLHWVADHRWHWISAPNSRMNLSAAGFEWLMTPLYTLTHSDRFFFLINIVSFALLPGLIYAVMVELGISKRVAWSWMWLLPAAGCFATQAGSVGNDSFSTVYFLSALYFTLRARRTRRLSDFWIGAFAIALLTSAKASNLPLLLPWAIAALPSMGWLVRRAWASIGLALVWVAASFLPIAIANTVYSGKWTGDPGNTSRLEIKNPVYGLVGNSLQLLTQNAQPPVVPFAAKWNQKAAEFLATPFGKTLHLNFPRLGLGAGEIAGEEGAGLGLGFLLLLGLSLAAALGQPRLFAQLRSNAGRHSLALWVIAGGWGAILAYMAKMGSESAARIFTPYYLCVLFGILWLPGNAGLVRRRWWKICAGLVAFSILPVLIVHPSRPLWPALTLLERGGPNRTLAVYASYRNRPDCLAALRKYITDEDKIVGFMGADDTELSLWRPFGSRKVVEVSPASLPLFAQHPHLIFTRTEAVEAIFGQPFEAWLAAVHATVVGKESIVEKTSAGPQDWYVLRLNAPAPQALSSGAQAH